MKDLNRVVLIGRLTKNIELRYSNSGVCFGYFSVAVNRSRKTDSGYADEVSFFECDIVGKTAESLSTYLRKGSRLPLRASWCSSGGSRMGLTAVKLPYLSIRFSFSAGPLLPSPGITAAVIPGITHRKRQRPHRWGSIRGRSRHSLMSLWMIFCFNGVHATRNAGKTEKGSFFRVNFNLKGNAEKRRNYRFGTAAEIRTFTEILLPRSMCAEGCLYSRFCLFDEKRPKSDRRR